MSTRVTAWMSSVILQFAFISLKFGTRFSSFEPYCKHSAHVLTRCAWDVAFRQDPHLSKPSSFGLSSVVDIRRGVYFGSIPDFSSVLRHFVPVTRTQLWRLLCASWKIMCWYGKDLPANLSYRHVPALHLSSNHIPYRFWRGTIDSQLGSFPAGLARMLPSPFPFTAA